MQGKNKRQGKKVNGNTHYISSIKLVTKKFLDLSRSSRAKQRQRNVQKKWKGREGMGGGRERKEGKGGRKGRTV